MDSSDAAQSADLIAELRGDTPPLGAEAMTRIRSKLELSIGVVPQATPESGIEQLAKASSAAVKGSSAPFVLALAIGAGIGAAGHALVASPGVHVIYRDRIVEVRAPAPAPSVTATDASPEAPPAPAAENRASLRRPVASASATLVELTPAPEVDEGLSAELALLDQARKAFGSGNPEAALEKLRVHSERYPASRLEQEREALSVKALIGAGRYAEARAQGERFRQRYPKSMLLDSVEKALATIP